MSVIQVSNLSKSYRLGAIGGGTLRADVSRWWARLRRLPDPNLRIGQKDDARLNGQQFWALQDVSFEVRHGEILGVIGRNGAGKSTLLKILSRVTAPTRGEVRVKGRVASLLEVGTGFHPELTGRENVYLNGAILGMTKAEVKKKFDEIVAFSGVEEFIDTPVKRYSSGMYVRLAFAVAAHLEPEVLIVDEVLAVGDGAFQKKCIERMAAVAQQGRTVLFVSHNMAAVRKLCGRSILLDDGRKEADCDSPTAITKHMGSRGNSGLALNTSGRRSRPTKAEIVDAWMENDASKTDTFLFGDAACLFMRVRVSQECCLSAEMVLRDQDGVPVAFAPSGWAFDWEVDLKPGEYTIDVRIPPMWFARGLYSIDLMLAETGTAFLDCIEHAISFQIADAAIGRRNWSFAQSRGQGFNLWDVEFSLLNEASLSPRV
jgi:lipopolysaccharide transport system ATP-binding protein